MRAIEVDQIEPGFLGTLGSVHEPAAQVADFFLGQCAGLDRIIGKGADGLGRHGQRHFLGVKVRAVHPGIGQLDARQRPVGFHLFRHLAQLRNVLVFPQAQLDERCDFRSVMHLALFGENHRPAALGLDPAHGCRRRGVTIPAAIAVRHLVEPVLCGMRANLDRLEQNIIPGIAHLDFSLCRLASDLWPHGGIIDLAA